MAISPVDVHRTERQSILVAKLVMERLAVLAMSGVEMRLEEYVLRASDFAVLDLDPTAPGINSLLRFTYQGARSMVEITPVEANNARDEDPVRGRVNMPLLEVAALCVPLNTMTLERELLDPFVTTPSLLEELAISSLMNVFRAHRELGLSFVQYNLIRPTSRKWGRHFALSVPDSCSLVQLADHLGVNAHLVEMKTDPNGRGLPVRWEAGVFYVTAVKQAAVDGGGILKEEGTGRWAIIVSSSKITLDSVPPSGDDGERLRSFEVRRLLCSQACASEQLG
jgi:hypothetical protein